MPVKTRLARIVLRLRRLATSAIIRIRHKKYHRESTHPKDTPRPSFSIPSVESFTVVSAHDYGMPNIKINPRNALSAEWLMLVEEGAPQKKMSRWASLRTRTMKPQRLRRSRSVMSQLKSSSGTRADINNVRKRRASSLVYSTILRRHKFEAKASREPLFDASTIQDKPEEKEVALDVCPKIKIPLHFSSRATIGFSYEEEEEEDQIPFSPEGYTPFSL